MRKVVFMCISQLPLDLGASVIRVDYARANIPNFSVGRFSSFCEDNDVYCLDNCSLHRLLSSSLLQHECRINLATPDLVAGDLIIYDIGGGNYNYFEVVPLGRAGRATRETNQAVLGTPTPNTPRQTGFVSEPEPAAPRRRSNRGNRQPGFLNEQETPQPRRRRTRQVDPDRAPGAGFVDSGFVEPNT